MLNRFSADKKRLISNFFSLSSAEVANYIFPLITLPYLVRVLGPEKFGLVAFAQAFVQYFVTLTDYGFNFSATRTISIHRNDLAKVSKIFSAVMIAKVILMLISFILLAALVLLIPKFRLDWVLYLFTYGIVIGNALLPIWFFQGMERMKFIAFLNLISKFIFTITIFIFVRKQSDYLFVPLSTSLGFLIVGVISLFIAAQYFQIHFSIPAAKDIFHELKEGWHIFISTAAVSLYTTSNILILGLLSNNTIVGYYSAAEKIARTGQKLLNPISQTIYPHINRLVLDSKERALHFIRKVLLIIGGMSFFISMGLFILASPIVYFILGQQFKDAVVILHILAFLPFIIALNNIFGIQTMLTFNMKEEFSKLIISAGVINILLAIVLVPLFQHVGTAISVLVTETYVTVTMYVFLHRKGILNLWPKR